MAQRGRPVIYKNPCGTHAGWQKHQKEQTPFCEPCLEARRAYKRARHKKNPEENREYNRKWRKANPDAKRESQRRRRAKKSVPYKESAVLLIYGTDCWICGGEIDLKAPRNCRGDNWEKGLHIDHVIPIAKGGEDTVFNVRPAHALCNVSKGAKLVESSATASQ
jgi:5-methylcytosine-specific restriction endonuclease McrA